MKVEVFSCKNYLINLYQPFECSCYDISFGSVDDVLTVSSNPVKAQCADEATACSSNYEIKQSESLREEGDKTKVIKFLFSIESKLLLFIIWNIQQQILKQIYKDKQFCFFINNDKYKTIFNVAFDLFNLAFRDKFNPTSM